MTSRFMVGDTVQTRLGKGVIRDIRNGGRLVVDVHGRALIVHEREISAITQGHKRSQASAVSADGPEHTTPTRVRRSPVGEVDLHGLTVEQALDRVQQALSKALLADIGELRLIHGRSGGRIRAALHRHLRETPGIRSFRIDPRNEGVTIVSL
jgi:dsDNA-specific endonuclease/ATPase MutS2